MTSAAIPLPAPSAPTSAAPAREHLAWIDHFRALAILMIVALHAGNALLQRGLARQTPAAEIAAAANDILFHSATLYFAIISGLLYGRLFRHRPYGGFLRGRLANIGVPYLVVSAALTALLWAVAVRSGRREGDILGLIELTATNILRGDAWNTLWYIPVVLGFCLLSPLLLALIQHPRLRWAAALLMLLPLVFSRTGTVLTLSIFIHFLGAYVFGMIVGRHLGAAVALLKRRLAAIALVALATSAALAWAYAAGIDRLGPGPIDDVSLRESLFYMQRLAIAGLLIVALEAWSRRAAPARDALLAPVATMSFGIYFVHGPLLRPVARVIGALVPPDQPWWALLLAITATAAIGLALSLAIVAAVRKLAGRWSRYLVGA